MTNNKPNKIGDNILRALQKRGKSQAWLAKQWDPPKSRTQINKWVHNRNVPSTDFLADIADFLDFTLEEIRTGNFRDERTVVGQEYDEVVEGYINDIMNTFEIVASKSDLSQRKVNAYKKKIRNSIDLIIDYQREA